MTARMGVMSFMCTIFERAKAPPTLIATPRSAVISGSPAATIEPSVINSTTAATATPIASVDPMDGVLLSESLGMAVIPEPACSTSVTALITLSGTEEGSDVC
ncbi:hypothetical protein D3C71_1456760 [compost metagenome]